MLLEEGLSAHGLHVDCASTPVGAVELVRRPQLRHPSLRRESLRQRLHRSPATKPPQQILSAAGANKPAVIFMTGDLVEAVGCRLREPRRLQKPFRISEVLAIFRDIVAAIPAVKR